MRRVQRSSSSRSAPVAPHEAGATVDLYQRAMASTARILDLIDTEVVQRDGEVQVDSIRGDVSFEGIDFAYPDRPPLLKGFSLSIPAGSTVGVVGPNGAGKSTLVRMLLRFFEPSQGRVVVDGHDVQDLPLEPCAETSASWRGNMALPGTVRETWRTGDPTPPADPRGPAGRGGARLRGGLATRARHRHRRAWPKLPRPAAAALHRTRRPAGPPILILTRPPPQSVTRPSGPSSARCVRSPRGAPRWSSRTGCRPSYTPASSWSSTRGRSRSKAHELVAKEVCMPVYGRHQGFGD